MHYINFILAVLTSLFIPTLLKFLDFHISRSTRLNERVKATQLYYELKSKKTSSIELERAAQAMVSNQNATVDLVDTFVEIYQLNNDFRELNQDINVVISAKKYLTFDMEEELRDRIVFIEKLSSKSKRSKFKWKNNVYYILCVTIACIPFVYLGRTLDAIANGQTWVNFYFGYQTHALILCIYSIFIFITGIIFAFRYSNDVSNLNDAEKLLNKIKVKFIFSSPKKQLSELERNATVKIVTTPTTPQLAD